MWNTFLYGCIYFSYFRLSTIARPKQHHWPVQRCARGLLFVGDLRAREIRRNSHLGWNSRSFPLTFLFSLSPVVTYHARMTRVILSRLVVDNVALSRARHKSQWWDTNSVTHTYMTYIRQIYIYEIFICVYIYTYICIYIYIYTYIFKLALRFRLSCTCLLRVTASRRVVSEDAGGIADGGEERMEKVRDRMKRWE